MTCPPPDVVSPPKAWPDLDAGTLLSSLPDAVLVVDEVGALLWANHRAEQELGIDATDCGGSTLDRIHPDDQVTASSSLLSVQRKEVGSTVELRARVPDGTWAPYEVRGWSGLHDPGVRGIVCVLRRLSDRDGWAVAEGDARRRAAILDHLPGLTLLLDRHSRLQGASRAFTSALGVDLESSLGRSLIDLVVPEDTGTVRDALRLLLTEGGHRSFEARLRAADAGPLVPFWLTAVDLLDDGSVQAIVVSGIPIAELVEARSDLTHRATHDPLTGLANRTLILEHLELALARSVNTTARVGVISCDIDGFRVVNDGSGHDIGDVVLVEIARRITAVLDPDDLTGRLGGDEIMAVCVRDEVAEVETAMSAMVRSVEEPITTPAGTVQVSLSAGYAVARQGGRAEDLIRRADADMDAHKRRNGG